MRSSTSFAKADRFNPLAGSANAAAAAKPAARSAGGAPTAGGAAGGRGEVFSAGALNKNVNSGQVRFRVNLR